MVALGRVGGEREIGQDLAQEQPGAERARHEVGVLALPAEPGRWRERLLQDRCRVDEDLDRAPALGGEPAGELLEAALDQLVIVAMAGVDRDRAALAPREHRQRVLVRAIVEAEHDRALRRRPEAPRALPARRVAREPAHLALPAGGEEGVPGGLDRPRQVGRGEARDVEALRPGARPDQGLQPLAVDGRRRPACSSVVAMALR